jgi:hypothetical protein
MPLRSRAFAKLESFPPLSSLPTQCERSCWPCTTTRQRILPIAGWTMGSCQKENFWKYPQNKRPNKRPELSVIAFQVRFHYGSEPQLIPSPMRASFVSLPGPSRIRCREINEADANEIIDLLTKGFRGRYHRTRAFWANALHRLSEHRTPPGFPKYGYLLESDGTLVGLILQIFSSILVNGEPTIRCNLSSWYVEPRFRSYAALLISHALRHKNVTYYNISPVPHTLPILEAQRFTPYCRGRLVTVPMFSGLSHGCRVATVRLGLRAAEYLNASEIELLTDHASYGCICLTCTSANRRFPFVFAPARKFGVIRFVSLIYCRDLANFVQFAGPLGRFLARQGFPLVVLDSNGHIPGLIDMYFGQRPKYFKGPVQLRLGDVAYSERAMFGV